MKAIAKVLSESFVFSRARHLHELNLSDWSYPLTKWQKLTIGVYLILHDYSEGVFPRKFNDEEATFEAEKSARESMLDLGQTHEELNLGRMRKPYWHGPRCSGYLKDYIEIQTALYDCGVRPPASLLEVGCGAGWLAEPLAVTGFRVLATSLETIDEEAIQLRKKSIETKGVPAQLEFRQAPMEYVHENVKDLDPFDAAYVYEALHHAHDWRKAISSLYEVLAPGGWCFIFSEPNVLHTFISYRVGRLLNTHEVGLSSAQIRNHMRELGFTKVKLLKNRVHWWKKPLWIAAQKGA